VTGERFNQAAATLRKTLAHYRSVFADRNIALLLGAGFFSEVGDWFNTVALISLSFRFGDGALGVGGMLAVRMLTRLLCQGPAGALVDRFPGRTVLFATQLVMAVIAGAFLLLVGMPEPWLLYGLVIALEGANCVARPAFMVVLKREAPEELRASANGALFASQTTAQLVGPLLGAAALALVGPAAVFALNGLTFLAVAAAVTRLRGGLSDTPAPIAPVDVGAAGEPASRRAGYRWLVRRGDLSLYALVCLSLALLVQATIALFVVRANALGLGDGGVGIFYAAVAAGSIAGSLVAGVRAPHPAPLYPAAVAMLVCAAALAVFGMAAVALVAIVALVVAGFATDFYEVVGLTHFQLAIPDDAFGRFFSIFLIALSAGGLVGALAGPVLEQRFGVGGSLIALAAPAAALAVLLAALSRLWQTAGR
jgi:MFS family permease